MRELISQIGVAILCFALVFSFTPGPGLAGCESAYANASVGVGSMKTLADGDNNGLGVGPDDFGAYLTAGYGDEPICSYTTCEVAGVPSEYFELGVYGLTITRRGSWIAGAPALRFQLIDRDGKVVGKRVILFNGGSASVTFGLDELSAATGEEGFCRVSFLETDVSGRGLSLQQQAIDVMIARRSGSWYLLPDASYAGWSAKGSSKEAAFRDELNRIADPSEFLDYNWESDAATVKIPEATLVKIRSSAQSAVKGCQSQPAMAAALYNWIGQNISYRESDNYWDLGDDYFAADQCSFGTYENGYGVCGGITNLYVCMCRCVGIPAISVLGSVGTGESHSWAAVYLDGGWRFVEPTSVAGGGALGPSIVSAGNFCASPEFFGMGHQCGNSVYETIRDNRAQHLEVKKSVKKLKAKKLRKKARSVKAFSVLGAQTKLSYSKNGGSRYVSVNKKTGKLKVRKGTKRGTYKIEVEACAKGTQMWDEAIVYFKAKVKVA